MCTCPADWSSREAHLSSARTKRKTGHSRTLQPAERRRLHGWSLNKVPLNSFVFCSGSQNRKENPKRNALCDFSEVKPQVNRASSRRVYALSVLSPRGLPENTCVIQVTHRWQGKSLGSERCKGKASSRAPDLLLQREIRASYQIKRGWQVGCKCLSQVFNGSCVRSSDGAAVWGQVLPLRSRPTWQTMKAQAALWLKDGHTHTLQPFFLRQ